ncbi:uncharacterized protein OCT59_023793 [Rhizophagus irregularis]|uniref:uncharacterized protein n=1 Tax=Rhizophagus irregularis TaxID=588596 RepID=UPI000CC841C8|nr:hypothetical protein OCT59_023793 [Rhizophagus irregularis]
MDLHHELCDDISHIVTFIKVKRTDEIFGGYNPLIWGGSSSGWGRTKDSFIFSFKNNDVKDAIISNIENTDYAIYYHYKGGPCFGDDILVGIAQITMVFVIKRCVMRKR